MIHMQEDLGRFFFAINVYALLFIFVFFFLPFHDLLPPEALAVHLGLGLHKFVAGVVNGIAVIFFEVI